MFRVIQQISQAAPETPAVHLIYSQIDNVLSPNCDLTLTEQTSSGADLSISSRVDGLIDPVKALRVTHSSPRRIAQF
jgi:hypothetical protein